MRRFCSLLPIAIFAAAHTAAAQEVVLDGTLRPENAGVVPLAPIGSPFTFEISDTMGIAAGPNLFHSFEQFSLARDEVAHFSGSGSYDNVIARVTGASPSLIEGVISADPQVGTQGFFLLNRNGITFRGDPSEQLAHLALPGSFHASTADRLLFAGRSFETDGSGGDPVFALDVDPTGWGFDPGAAADILVDNTLPLAVQDGRTLSLVAGDVVVTRTAKVEALEGTIEIAAVGSQAGDVPLALEGYVAGGDGLGELRFEDDALVRAGSGGSGTDQGRIVLRGGELLIERSEFAAGGNAGDDGLAVDVQVTGDAVLRDRARVRLARADDVGLAGARIEAASLSLDGTGTFIFASSNGGTADTQNEGIELVAPEVSVTGSAFVLANVSDGGSGIDVGVRTERLTVDNGRIASRTVGTGDGGAIEIGSVDGSRAEVVRIENGGEIETETEGAGRAGDIEVSADSIRVVGPGSLIASFSGANAEDPGVEDAGRTISGGSVTLDADLLEVESGGRVETATLGDFDAGQLRVHVGDVRIVGGTPAGRETGLFATSGRSSTERAAGDAGGLEIIGDRLSVRGGRAAISTRSWGDGRAGILFVDMEESVVLTGDATGAPVMIASAFGGDHQGIADERPGLQIETGELRLLEGARVLSSALATGDAGSILISADVLEISGGSGQSGSEIRSEAVFDSTGAGDGGLIEIQLGGDLELADGGQISVITGGPGRSGGVSITADGVVRVASGAAITSEAQVGEVVSPPDAAGDIAILAGSGLVLDGGSIRATGVGPVNAGGIMIDAGPMFYASDGEVTTEAEDAFGADISISATDRIELVDSVVSTSVLGDELPVDAGDIDIDPRFVILNESEIITKAIIGNGGDITIVTDQLLTSGGSTISASSELGIDGEIVTTGPENLIATDLNPLPSNIIDISSMLAAHCAARRGAGISLAMVGREGQSDIASGDVSSWMPLDALDAAGARTGDGKNESDEAERPLAPAPAPEPGGEDDARKSTGDDDRGGADGGERNETSTPVFDPLPWLTMDCDPRLVGDVEGSGRRRAPGEAS